MEQKEEPKRVIIGNHIVIGEVDPEAAKEVWGDVKSDLTVASFTIMDKIKAFFGF